MGHICATQLNSLQLFKIYSMFSSSFLSGYTKWLAPTFILITVAASDAASQISMRNHLNFFVGSQGVACQKIWNGSNIDFLNYIDAQGYSGNYMYIGAMWHFELGNKIEGKFMVSMQSDMAPVMLNFNASYFPRKSLGLGVSYFGYPQTIENFQLHHQNDVGLVSFYSYARYRRIYNTGLALGPEYKFRRRYVTFDLKLHGGVRWVSTFSEGFTQKQINGNYIRTIEYHTQKSPSMYFFPQAELGIHLFQIGKYSVGLKGKVLLELSSRKIDYSQSISEWVYAPYTRNVTTQSHKYRKVDYDFGLNFSW